MQKKKIQAHRHAKNKIQVHSRVSAKKKISSAQQGKCEKKFQAHSRASAKKIQAHSRVSAKKKKNSSARQGCCVYSVRSRLPCCSLPCCAGSAYPAVLFFFFALTLLCPYFSTRLTTLMRPYLFSLNYPAVLLISSHLPCCVLIFTLTLLCSYFLRTLRPDSKYLTR